MNILFALFIYLISIAIHELTHIIIYWVFFNEWAEVKLNRFGIMKIMCRYKMTILQVKLFLGMPIITGLLSYVLFITYFPLEGTAACIGYLIACGVDFWNLIKVEVHRKND